jgi:3-methylcrotonyl-CoA carboxylase alpha subunit
VYSQADADAMHVSMADDAVAIGPAEAVHSYLNIDRIIAAARQSGAAAIHPGYGFLSENADFARACQAADIVFVGPPVAAIETMGSKMASKRLMEQAGVPVLPGYHGDVQDPDFLAQQAQAVGYPLLIKASAGGGGKGMRLVTDEQEFAAQLAGAKREAAAAFGNDAVLLERFLTSPKHIEVQLMADRHGEVVHLFERDCSVQRRHQKVIEEAPAPTVSAPLREKLGQTAIMAARKVGYVGAGTVEFIAEGDEFFFMEMNTRLQVEHPVTEAITGLDLVELQLQVAAGEPLPVAQQDLHIHGHAVEVRLYAENPANRFLPSTGRLHHFHVPNSIRIDTGVRTGDEISPHYDPMLAKLIAHGPDRQSAVAALASALRGAEVAGVEHNLGYLIGVLEHDAFVRGDYTTSIADSVHEDVVPDQHAAFAVLAALFVLEEQQGSDPWQCASGFRSNLPARKRVLLRRGKKELQVDIGDVTASVNATVLSLGAVHEAVTGAVNARIEGHNRHARVLRVANFLYVMCDGHTERFIELTDDISRYQNQALSRGGIAAPMPGQVIAVNVKAGDAVKQGDVLVVVEAMKMEHSVRAPQAGTVKKVLFAPGDRVEEGAALVELE